MKKVSIYAHDGSEHSWSTDNEPEIVDAVILVVIPIEALNPRSILRPESYGHKMYIPLISISWYTCEDYIETSERSQV